MGRFNSKTGKQSWEPPAAAEGTGAAEAAGEMPGVQAAAHGEKRKTPDSVSIECVSLSLFSLPSLFLPDAHFCSRCPPYAKTLAHCSATHAPCSTPLPAPPPSLSVFTNNTPLVEQQLARCPKIAMLEQQHQEERFTQKSKQAKNQQQLKRRLPKSKRLRGLGGLHLFWGR